MAARLVFVTFAMAAVLLSAGGADAGANPETFTDPTGDSGNAPDITSVVVANSASGEITFRVKLSGLVVPSDTRVLIAIDSDRSPSTGHDGSDYVLIGDLSDNGFVLVRWDGSQFVETPESTFSAGVDGSSVVFAVNKSELGNTTAFDFWVRSLEGSMFAAAHEDNAPDHGTFTYELGPGAVPQLSGKLSHTPKARAGKPFAAVITVARSDGVPMDLTLDDLRCVATVGGHRLHIRVADALGAQAGCLWNLSRKSRGQTLRATVKVTLDGASVTKTFATKIR